MARSTRIRPDELSQLEKRLLYFLFRCTYATRAHIEAYLFPGRGTDVVKRALPKLRKAGFIGAWAVTGNDHNGNTVRKYHVYWITRHGSQAIQSTLLTDRDSHLSTPGAVGRGKAEEARERQDPSAVNFLQHDLRALTFTVDLINELRDWFSKTPGLDVRFDMEYPISAVDASGKAVTIATLLGGSPARDPHPIGFATSPPRLPGRFRTIDPDARIAVHWETDSGSKRHDFLIEYTRTQTPQAIWKKLAAYDWLLNVWGDDAIDADGFTVIFVCDYREPPGSDKRARHAEVHYADFADGVVHGRIAEAGAPRQVEGMTDAQRDQLWNSYALYCNRSALLFCNRRAVRSFVQAQQSLIRDRGDDAIRGARWTPPEWVGMHAWGLPALPGTGAMPESTHLLAVLNGERRPYGRRPQSARY